MKFYDTLERLGLGRPVTDIYASICERVIQRIEWGQKVVEVRLHPAWYAELARNLAAHMRYSSPDSFFPRNTGIMALRVNNVSFTVIADVDVSFIEIRVDPDSVYPWDWVEYCKGN